MSDTPRTDDAVEWWGPGSPSYAVDPDFARQLERELEQAKALLLEAIEIMPRSRVNHEWYTDAASLAERIDKFLG